MTNDAINITMSTILLIGGIAFCVWMVSSCSKDTELQNSNRKIECDNKRSEYSEIDKLKCKEDYKILLKEMKRQVEKIPDVTLSHYTNHYPVYTDNGKNKSRALKLYKELMEEAVNSKVK